MIQRGSPPSQTLAFLISVEMVETQVTTEDISNQLLGSLNFTEGVGKVELECLGVIPEYDEPTEGN